MIYCQSLATSLKVGSMSRLRRDTTFNAVASKSYHNVEADDLVMCVAIEQYKGAGESRPVTIVTCLLSNGQLGDVRFSKVSIIPGVFERID